MKKLISVIILVVAVTIINPAVFAKDTSGKSAGDNFTDISKHWAREAINKIADQSTFAGKDGKFQPDKSITRSEFILMLHKALGINIMYFKATDINEYFSDVKNEDIYASELYDLATTGIIDYKGSFRPNSCLSREEMIHFVMNAYKYEMGDQYKQIKLPAKPFSDDKKLNPLYSGDITRAEYMGLIVRPSSNCFFPKDNATRAQAAVVIDRLLIALEKDKAEEKAEVDIVPQASMADGTIHMKLTITNGTKERLVINQSSGYKYDFEILDADKQVLYKWSSDKAFTMMVTQSVIEPGKSLEFNADVEKEAFDQIAEKAVYMRAYLIGSTDAFSINPDGYETLIKEN